MAEVLPGNNTFEKDLSKTGAMKYEYLKNQFDRYIVGTIPTLENPKVDLNYNEMYKMWDYASKNYPGEYDQFFEESILPVKMTKIVERLENGGQESKYFKDRKLRQLTATQKVINILSDDHNNKLTS